MPFARGWLSFVYMTQGNHQKAIETASAEPVSFSRLTSLASVHGALGNHDEAQEAQQKLLDEYGDLAAFQQAVIFAYWGDYDKSVEYLELGFEVRDPGMGLVKGPIFDVLNDHPGYRAVLAKMDLADD
jgi:tetratricopeptide (TPR) repeat protein